MSEFGQLLCAHAFARFGLSIKVIVAAAASLEMRPFNGFVIVAAFVEWPRAISRVELERAVAIFQSGDGLDLVARDSSVDIAARCAARVVVGPGSGFSMCASFDGKPDAPSG